MLFPIFENQVQAFSYFELPGTFSDCSMLNCQLSLGLQGLVCFDSHVLFIYLNVNFLLDDLGLTRNKY